MTSASQSRKRNFMMKTKAKWADMTIKVGASWVAMSPMVALQLSCEKSPPTALAAPEVHFHALSSNTPAPPPCLILLDKWQIDYVSIYINMTIEWGVLYWICGQICACGSSHRAALSSHTTSNDASMYDKLFAIWTFLWIFMGVTAEGAEHGWLLECHHLWEVLSSSHIVSNE